MISENPKDQWIYDLAAEYEWHGKDLYAPVTFDVDGIVDFANALLAARPVKLDDVEQYRQQMAGISSAAFGHWKEGDSIHPDFDTVTLRDVAKLYAKYQRVRQSRDQLTSSLRNLIAATDAYSTVHAPDGDDAARMVEYAEALNNARAALAVAGAA